MYEEETKYGKRLFIWIIVIGALLAGGITTCNLVCNTAKKAVHAQDAVEVYETFQEISNTCDKINTDLCNMRGIPETDKMFEQFSKLQRINALQTNLNRWVQEYNAKSKMWGRQLWKSSKLPFQLDVNQFNCYQK